MIKQGKITKSEIAMLAATVVLVIVALVIHFVDGKGTSHGDYTIRTWRAKEPAEAPAPIDVNTADEEGLQKLPGIGPALAERIIEDRTANGPYATLDELTRVSGIGVKTVESLRPYAVVGSEEQEEVSEDPGS